MSYKWPGIPNGDYSFDHGRAVWNKIINYLRRLSEKLDADIVDATADRRGMMTAADKAALDAVPDTYETQEHAAETYETQEHAADTYETKTHAEATYETKANAIEALSASGTTVTYTKGDGTTGTFETQDHDTIYTHPTYTPRTGNPTQDLTPGFGSTVTVSQIVTDATGHVTAANDKTITIPATEASSATAGLMSAADKTTFDAIPTTYALKNSVLANNSLCRTSPAGHIAYALKDGTSGDPNDLEVCDFGWNAYLGHGAYLGLRSASHGTDPGIFDLGASDGVNISKLIGRPNGSLTWNGNPIITIADLVTQTTNGIMSAVDKLKLDGILSTLNFNPSLTAGAYYKIKIGTIIILVGRAFSAASAISPLVFPEAFPTSCFAVVATPMYWDRDLYVLMTGSFSKTGCNVITAYYNGNASPASTSYQAREYSWVALGR